MGGPPCGLVMVVCGLLVLVSNAVEAVDRGASAWNMVTIAVGALVLFSGAGAVARSAR